jgi:hypothetical protein
MLNIAWFLNNVDMELKAYDWIGIQYYYLGNLEKAKFYHNKMIDGEYEKADSDLKKLGIAKVENNLGVQGIMK